MSPGQPGGVFGPGCNLEHAAPLLRQDEIGVAHAVGDAQRR